MTTFYDRRGVGVASLLALAVVILGLLLGFWQLRRADEKTALQSAQDRALAAPALDLNTAAEVPDGASLQVTGVFDAGRSVFLDNRTREGVAGFHVLTPMKLAGKGREVMVLRGWIARDPVDRARLPIVQTPSEPVRVQGMALSTLQQPMMLGEEPAPGPDDRLWQHFTFEKFSVWSGVALYPLILRQTVAPDYQDGLARDWNQPGVSVDRHRAYAFQWFALTAAAILTWLILLWRRNVNRD